MELLDLATPAGIALLAGLLVQLIKKNIFLPEDKKYSLMILGISLLICMVLGLASVSLLEIEFKVGLMNGGSAWILSTFGYQITKGTGKAIKP